MPGSSENQSTQKSSNGISIHHRLWGKLVEQFILPIGDRLYQQGMMRNLQFLRKSQWWTRDQVTEYRDRRLASLIELVYREVPFYRDLMVQSGVKPEEILHAQDLHRLPIVTKDMLRSAYPNRLVRSTGNKTYEACSSGSTGAPLCVREDSQTAGTYRAAFLLALEWLGWSIGIPHVQTGMTLTRSQGRHLKDLLLGCHYVSAYDLRDEHLDSILEYMENHKVKFLWGYPGSLYYLAKRALQKGWNRPLLATATWGDNLYSHYRATIEQAFGTRVFDQYGCAEGILISAQCGIENHYHVFSTDVIVEYVDDSNHPVPHNTPGNIVLTRLYPGPTPLIRYKVGDIGAPISEIMCACGRGLELMQHIEGRDTDVVLTPSGNRLIVHFFTGILEFYPEIDYFQVTQDEIGSITLKIVPRKTIDETLVKQILSQLHERGADLHIQVEFVNNIPLSPSGKRRFVINRIPKTDGIQ